MDAATMTAFCTTSFQLKFALAGRKPNLAFLQTRLPPIDRVASVVVRSSGLEQRSPGNSAGDDFSGWANGDDFSGWANGDPKPTLVGIPAPSFVPAALLSLPGKVLVPAFVDQHHSQAFSALQDLKVIEDGVQPGDLCTQREYARWLLKASNALSRNTTSEVLPAIYIKNVTELSFDDITPEDPDFPYIQGLAEARIIASKLSRHDMQSYGDEDRNPSYFFPDSLLSPSRSREFLRKHSYQQLTKRLSHNCKILLPSHKNMHFFLFSPSHKNMHFLILVLTLLSFVIFGVKIVQQLTRFMDIDNVNTDAWPAVVADVAAGDKGIIALAFGNTRRFTCDKSTGCHCTYWGCFSQLE
ncbi:uncharacterized protein LOC121743665 isoform X2 [Salvia splendens]|uniref:uncharacterized protein LOC121743665 isoform X2 n=1 Tax=Salvia splendens TaxID=180675 RepID=UPI001C2745F6|nr:uncharacterized protein LOC121743665 isoform X2 [Salvia splendens]